MAKVQIFVNISFFSDVMFSKPRFLGFSPFQICSVTEIICHVVSSLRKLLLHSLHKAKDHKGNQDWVFIGRTDVEAETPTLWLPDEKSWLIWKDPDAGKDWGQEEKGMTEDEIVGWHHWLNGDEFEQTPGVGDGQGGLACCGQWGCKESDMTEWLNWTDIW